MRAWTKIWIAVVAACIAATVYEIPNGRLVWRSVSMARRMKAKPVNKAATHSLLTDEIAATDPEAADILRYCLADANDEELANLAAKYPDNEFLQAQLAYKLTDVNLVDPRAVGLLVDRLIALSPDNAHYRYIKGWVLLKLHRNTVSELEALEQFKQGNDLPEFTLPYSKYKQRVDRLSDRAGIGLLDRRRAVPGETGWYWDLGIFLQRSRGTYPALSHDSFRSISAEVSKVADRVIDRARTYGSLEAGCLLLLWTEGTRLRELDLSGEQTQQVRFRLARAMQINDNVLQRCSDEMFAAVIGLMTIALVVALLTVVLLPGSFPLVWLFLVIVNGLRGRAEDISLGIKSPILFAIGLLGFFGLCALYGILAKILPERWLTGLAFVGTATIMWICLVLLARIRPVDRTRFEHSRRSARRFCKPLWLLGVIADAVACFFVLAEPGAAEWLIFAAVLIGWSVFCVIAWALATFRHHIFRIINYRALLRNRLVQLAFVLLFMIGILGLLRPIPVVPWIMAFVTILLIGFVSVQAPGSLFASLHGVCRIFSSEGQIVEARTKIARIMGAVLLLCWVTILIGVHLSAPRWSRLDTLFADPLSLYRPLPLVNRESYERALSKRYSTDPNAPVRPRFSEDGGLPEELHLASPEDLSALINERRAAGNPIREKMLLELMRRGAHDIRPVVVDALKEPNALDVLIRRAKWSDMSVKDQLEKIFEEKMTKLGETISPIRKNPNSTESLIIRLRWGDKTAEAELEHALEAKIVELSERVPDVENRSDIRSELRMLLEMNSALPWSAPQESEHYEFALMMEEQFPELTSLFGPSDPNTVREIQKGKDRSERVQKLIVDANMPELLEENPSGKEIGDSELITSLFNIAGALAFISGHQEAEARFSRLLGLAGEWRKDSSQEGLRRSAVVSYDGGIWAGDLWWQPCIFYRALTGVPRAGVAALLKDYILHRQLADPFEEDEFADVLQRAGDRELAEWVFQKVAESPPTTEVPYFPDGIPVGRPIRPSEVKEEKRRKDIAHTYLEAAFPHLTSESIPLLLEHLDSDNDQLRAFVVWRMTSLGYQWTDEQLAAIRQDSYWKVRLNAFFALDRDDLATAIEDESPLVRVVVRMLVQFDSP